MADRPNVATGLALSAALAYGLVPVLTKLAHINGIPAIDSTLVRTALAVAVYGAIVVLAGYRVAISRANIGPLSALTVSTFVISTGYLASLQFIPVGLAVIVFFTFPVFMLFVSPLVERRSIGASRLGLAMLGFAGLAIAIAPTTDTVDPRGLLLAALAAMAAVVQFYSARALAGSMHAVAFGFIAHLGFLPAVFVLAWWLDGGGLAFITSTSVGAFGHPALFGLAALYVIGYFLQMRACTLAPASTVAPFFNLEPVTTMLLAALVLGETLSVNQYVGGSMVLAAVIAVGVGDRLAPRQRRAQGRNA